MVYNIVIKGILAILEPKCSRCYSRFLFLL